LKIDTANTNFLKFVLRYNRCSQMTE